MKKLLVCLFILLQVISHAQKFQRISGNISTYYNPNGSVLSINGTNYLLGYPTDRGFRLDTTTQNGTLVSGKNYQSSNSTAALLFNGFTVDSSGAKYVYGQGGHLPSQFERDAIIYKINPDGTVAWKNSVVSTAFDDEFQDAYVSRSGSIYAVGQGENSIGFTQPLVAKFNSSGQLQFANIYNAEPETGMITEDRVKIFAINDTAIFIVASVFTEWGTSLIFMTKIDTLGNPAWTKFTSITKDIELKDIAVNDTSVYLTGEILEENNVYITDVFLLNMNFSGHTNWLKTYGNSQDEEGWTCAVQPDGKVLVGGRTKFSTSTYCDFLFVLLDENGNELNARRRIAGQDDFLVSILPTDSSGSFVALGIRYSGSNQSLYLESDYRGSSCNGSTYYLAEKVFSPLTDSCNTTLIPCTIGPVPYTLTLSNATPPFTTYSCNNSCLLNTAINSFPHKFCVGDTLRTSASDSTLVSYGWFIDDTAFSASDSITYSLSYPGIHKLKLVVADSSCTDSSVVYFDVKSFPVPQYSYLRHSHVLSFTNTSLDADYIRWRVSDGTTSTSDFFKYNFKDTGFVYYSLTAYNVCGEDSLNNRVYVNDSITASFSRAYDILSCSCSAESFVPTPDGGYLIGGSGSSYSLTKTDVFGNPLWSGVGGVKPIQAMATTDDLGVVCGSAWISSNTVTRIFKLDSVGKGMWTVGLNGDEIRGIAELPNHDIIAAGRVNSFSGALVVYINRFGTVVWSRQYTDLDFANGLIVKGQSIYIYGQVNTSSFGIIKLNFAGQEIWGRSYTYPFGGNVGYDMTFLSENKIVAIGESNAKWALCIDTLGDIQWSKTYTTWWNGGKIISRDGKLFLTASSSNPNTTPSRVLFLDSLGNSTGGIDYYWNASTPTLSKLCFNNEGQLSVVGKLSGYDIFLSKQFPDSSYSCFGGGTILSATNTMPVIGYGFGFSNTIPLYEYSYYDLTTFNISGSIYCSVSNCSPQANFSYAFSNPAVDFTSTSTGQIISVLWDFGDNQYSTQMNPSHIYWLPGQYNVCLHVNTVCGSDSICQQVTVLVTGNAQATSSDFSIWPNPATNEVNVAYGQNISYNVSLFDASGRCFISTKNITTDKISLDISLLSDGMYFLRVEDTDGHIGNKKLLIER